MPPLSMFKHQIYHTSLEVLNKSCTGTLNINSQPFSSSRHFRTTARVRNSCLSQGCPSGDIASTTCRSSTNTWRTALFRTGSSGLYPFDESAYTGCLLLSHNTKYGVSIILLIWNSVVTERHLLQIRQMNNRMVISCSSHGKGRINRNSRFIHLKPFLNAWV